MAKNPTLPKEYQETAFPYADGLNWHDQPLIKVDEKGFPSHKINPDALENDIPAYWRIHQKKLAVIILICTCFMLIRMVL